MNSDSFRSIVGGASRNQLTALSGLGTTETILTMGTDTGTTNAFVQIPQGNEILGANAPVDVNANSALSIDGLGMMTDYRGLRGRPYFNSASFDGHPFQIQLSAKVTTSNLNSTTAHKIILYQNSAAQLSGATSIFSALSSTTQPAGSSNVLIQAICLWDSTSQTLAGEAWSVWSGASSSTATYTSRTSFNISSVTLANLLFVASVKFNNGAANAITPVEFSVSML